MSEQAIHRMRQHRLFFANVLRSTRRSALVFLFIYQLLLCATNWYRNNVVDECAFSVFPSFVWRRCFSLRAINPKRFNEWSVFSHFLSHRWVLREKTCCIYVVLHVAMCSTAQCTRHIFLWKIQIICRARKVGLTAENLREFILRRSTTRNRLKDEKFTKQHCMSRQHTAKIFLSHSIFVSPFRLAVQFVSR